MKSLPWATIAKFANDAADMIRAQCNSDIRRSSKFYSDAYRVNFFLLLDAILYTPEYLSLIPGTGQWSQQQILAQMGGSYSARQSVVRALYCF